jgi:transmembrane sensor
MTRYPDHIREEALGWVVSTNDPEFDRWDEFTAWLEREPTNADAYHRLLASETALRPLIEPAIGVPQPAVEVQRSRRPWAIAASVAVLAAAGTAVVAPRLMTQSYSTAPGETRIVSLSGQDQLVMNGDTRLVLAGWDRRDIRLEQGQVLLRLRDQGKDKVELVSGDLTLVDVGTVFEVSRDGRSTRVIVSEGAVVADPEGAKLQLASGQRLDTEDGAIMLQAMPADASSVGAFERGQLVYVEETLDKVAEDLRRSTGIDISASAAIRSRRFSGTLSVSEVKRDPKSLEALLGVSLERAGNGWILGGKV